MKMGVAPVSVEARPFSWQIQIRPSEVLRQAQDERITPLQWILPVRGEPVEPRGPITVHNLLS
jgi:hypothetical protein